MNSKLWVPLSLLVLLSLISPSLIAGTEDIVFTDKSGRVLTMRDLQHSSGTFEWSLSSSVKVSDQARREHAAGRVAGNKGDYKEAIARFNAAAKAAPNWPYPNYDLAYIYLLQGAFADALKHYQLVDQGAPRGFFTVKTAVDTLRREQSGELPKGTYLNYVALEWEGDKQKVRSAVSAMTKSIPNFAPAWKAAAIFEDEPTRRLVMLEAGLKARPDAETKGFLLINKALRKF
jgi:tetratricopeptide (TPR) repeat protein